MKKLKRFLLGVLIVGFISTNLYSIPQEDVWDRDYYGRLTGKVVDAITGELVNEAFHINLFDCSKQDSADFLFSIESD